MIKKEIFSLFILVLLASCFGSKITVENSNNHVLVDNSYSFRIEGPKKCIATNCSSCKYEIYSIDDKLAFTITFESEVLPARSVNGKLYPESLIINTKFDFLQFGVANYPEMFDILNSKLSKRDISIIIVRHKLLVDGQINQENCEAFKKKYE